MKPEEVEKLLAGYAAGILEESERRALMQAALERQELFDALVEEEALRELLADPACRRKLLALLGAAPQPLWRRAAAWLRRPAGVAALASSAAALVLISSLVWRVERGRVREPAVVARPAVEAPAKATQAAPPAPPPPAAWRAPRPAARPTEAAASRDRPVPAPAPAAAALKAGAGTAATPEVKRVETFEEAPEVSAAERAAAPAALSLQDRAAAPLRWVVLRAGAEAGPDAVFRPGEPLALSVESARPGHVLLFERVEAGALRLVFPGAGQGNRLESGGKLTIPLEGLPGPGDRTLVLVLQPEAAGEAEVRFGMRAAAQAARPGALELGTDPRLRAEIVLKFR
jgi:hypothetical protein